MQKYFKFLLSLYRKSVKNILQRVRKSANITPSHSSNGDIQLFREESEMKHANNKDNKNETKKEKISSSLPSQEKLISAQNGKNSEPSQENKPKEATAEKMEMLAISVQNAKNVGLPTHRELSKDEKKYYRGLMEALIFLATEGISLGMLAQRVNLDRANVRQLIDELEDEYESRDGGIILREIGGSYQFITAPNYSTELGELYQGTPKRETLSRSTLETLAIICYRQPITLPEVEEVRGVSSRAMISALLQKKLIKPQGQRPVPGRPTLYATTREFLQHFALASLNDLPTLREIKELQFDEIE